MESNFAPPSSAGRGFASSLLLPSCPPSDLMVGLRPEQRRAWMLSCDASSCPEVCGLLRERCWELDIDEYYATVEDGRRYALLHMERKVRSTALERSIESLAPLGVSDVRIVGFGQSGDADGRAGDDRRWFEVLERHLREGDARVVKWRKDDGRRGGAPFREPTAAASPSPRPASAPEPRRDGGGGGGGGSSSSSSSSSFRADGRGDGNDDDGAMQAADATIHTAEREEGAPARLALLLAAREGELADARRRAEQDGRVIQSLRATIAQLEARLDDAVRAERGGLQRRSESLSEEGREAVVAGSCCCRCGYPCGADPTHRETVLLVDLRMERKRASVLERQLQEVGARLAAAQERAFAAEQRQAAKIDELIAEVNMMRREARAWEHSRELGRAELEMVRARLREAAEGARVR